VTTVSSFPSSVARRYGGALFDLAQAEHCVDEVEKHLTHFVALVEKNVDLHRLVTSPLFAARDQLVAIGSLIKMIGFGTGKASILVANFLQAVAANRRLPHLRSMVVVFRQLSMQARGEIYADIVSAHTLTKRQESELKQQLDQASGKNVTLRLRVDPAKLGGLVVRLGSRQFDTSLATKLSSLKMHLKEVG